ncbi:hypothetical protein DFQ28_002025 [Apophysomyces sp. BC1034]|nr:hypothetical protein DFQ28_002025 [Apophysomyces sp. BC1034]
MAADAGEVQSAYPDAPAEKSDLCDKHKRDARGEKAGPCECAAPGMAQAEPQRDGRGNGQHDARAAKRGNESPGGRCKIRHGRHGDTKSATHMLHV